MAIAFRCSVIFRLIVSRYPARTYGERIRQKRLEMGLTQRNVAKLLGVNEMSVVGWKGAMNLLSAGAREMESHVHTQVGAIRSECSLCQ